MKGMAEDLEARLASVCGVLNAAHAQLVQLVAEAVESGVWDVAGIRTAEQWIAWKTGIASARAKQMVQIASRSTELPVSMQTFADGEVSIDQIAVVTKFTPARNDSEVAGIAKHATVSQLRAKLGSYRRVVVPEAELAEPSAPEPERVDVAMAFFDDEGRWRMHADLSAERGAIPQKALEEARDALFKAGNKNVTWADAFEEVCLRSLATVKSVSRSDRYRILVHLNEDGGWLNGGQHLKDGVLKQLLSNTTLQAVFERGGRPVNLGRTARVVPHRVAALILDRDRMCRNPLCSATKGLEAHHVVHWTDGGPTNTCNLGALCRHCHRAHHAGKFSIVGNADNPDGLIFRRPDGTAMEGAAKPMPPDGPLPPSAKLFVHPTGERWLNRDTLVHPGSRHPTRRDTTRLHRTTRENMAPHPNPRRASRMGTQILRFRRNKRPRRTAALCLRHRRPRTRRKIPPLAFETVWWTAQFSGKTRVCQLTSSRSR
jgi:Domain of unknown function (DUF222)/HNH endonuclease